MQTEIINIDIDAPDSSEFASASVMFTLSGADADSTTGETVPAHGVSATLDASGEGSVTLWPVDRGYQGRHYVVTLYARDVAGNAVREYALGTIQPIDGDGPFDLGDLLGVGSGAVTPGVYRVIAPAEYDALVAAAAIANAAAASAASSEAAAANSAGLAAAAAAAGGFPVYDDTAEGITGVADGNPFVVIEDAGAHVYTRNGASADDSGWLTGPSFPTVAALIASTSTSLGVEGQTVTAGGFRYAVAASGATDHHLTTAGGLKLYVLATASGDYAVTAFDPAGGSADDLTAIQNAWDVGSEAVKKVVMDIALRASNQIKINSGQHVEWIEGAWSYAAGNSDTGSFITNTVGAGSSESIVSDVRLINPQISGEHYPASTVLTAGTGSTTTSVVFQAGASTVDDFYNGMQLQVVEGTGLASFAFISDYDGSTLTATLASALSGAPVSGDLVVVGSNDNALGFASGMSKLTVDGGVAKSFDATDMVPAAGGGKGLNIEQGVHDATVRGFRAYDLPNHAFFIAGKDGTAGNGEALRATAIRIEGGHAENCGGLIAAGGINSAADPDGDAADSYGIARGLTYKNVGHLPYRIVSSDQQKSGIISLLEAQNWTFSDITGYNESTYPASYPTDYASRVGFGLSGDVGALVWGHGRNLLFSNIRHHGDLDAVFRCARPRAAGDDVGPDAKPDQCYDWQARQVHVYGTVAEILAIDDNVAARVAADEWTGRLEVYVTDATLLCDVNMSSFAGIILEAVKRSEDGTEEKRVMGTPAQIIAAGNTFADYPAGTTDLTGPTRVIATFKEAKNFPSLAAGQTRTDTITVTGALTDESDIVFVGSNGAAVNGLTFEGYVSADDEVTVCTTNASDTAFDMSGFFLTGYVTRTS